MGEAFRSASDHPGEPPCPFIEFTRDLVQQLAQPAFLKSPDQRFTAVNESFCHLTGRSLGELLGHTEEQAFTNSPVPAAPHDLAPAATQSARPSFPRFGVSERFVVQEWMVPTTDEPSNCYTLGLVSLPGQLSHGIHFDWHASSSAREEALKAAQQELLRKERLMVLGQLAAGLAHQIRNPLAAISNAVAIARRQTPEANQRVHEALRIAGEEVWEANRTIADLLDFARIRPPQIGPVPLATLVAGALEAEPLPDTIKLELNLPALTLQVDERQVCDAVRNLIRNAREAMHGVGTLYFSATVTTGFAELSIRDTGEGVAEESQHLLFEPLVTSKPLGIGLGLSTARALVTNQGGALEYVTQSQGGACFVLRLPLAPN
jgi:signal transduction histidine kinase